jgi:uncharacterized protein YqeY
MAQNLTERVAADLIAAMKSKDAARLSVLRMAKAALKNREIEKMAPLEEAEVQKVLQALIKQREDSAGQFRAAARAELAAKEEAEVKVLREYLPEGASDAEIEAAVAAAVAQAGAVTAKDMGKVMKAALGALAAAGKPADGKKVNEAVRRRLAG